MDYKVVTFPRDKYYVGMKYCENETSNYHDMASFWSYYTERLYSSELATKLTDNNEAIGYRKYNQPGYRSTFDYYAACETEYLLEDIYGFDKIIIQKGYYALFKVNLKNKELKIQEIVENLNDVTNHKY